MRDDGCCMVRVRRCDRLIGALRRVYTVPIVHPRMHLAREQPGRLGERGREPDTPKGDQRLKPKRTMCDGMSHGAAVHLRMIDESALICDGLCSRRDSGQPSALGRFRV